MARSKSNKAKPAKAKEKKGKAAKKSQGREKPARVITAWDGTTKIVAATLADIKKAEKGKGEMDSKKLVRVPSKAVRTKLLDEAARAISARESLALPGHGGRPWKCDIKLVDDARGKKKMSGPLFRWYRGRLELAALPHILEKIPEVDQGVTARRRHRDDPSDDESSDEDSEDEYPHVPKTSLQERQVSSLSTVAWEDPDHPIPTIKRTWVSPDAVTFHSRKAATDHATELVKRDKLIDKVLHGFGGHGMMCRPVKPTRKVALEAGMYRFLRDGLWVVGQEEAWLEEALEVWKVREENKKKREEREREEEEEEEHAVDAEADEEKTGRTDPKTTAPASGDGDAQPTRKVTALDLYIDAKRDELIEMERKVSDVEKASFSGGDGASNCSNAKGGKPLTAEDATRELRIQWQSIREEERVTWEAMAMHRNSKTARKDVMKKELESEPTSKKQKLDITDQVAPAHAAQSASSSVEVSNIEAVKAPAAATVSSTESRPDLPTDGPTASTAAGFCEGSVQAGGEGDTDTSTKTSADGTSHTPRLVSPPTVDAADSTASITENAAAITSPTPPPVPIVRHLKKPRKTPKIAPSTHWRLTSPQIDACHTAVMEHYEKVMYTVKARNLYFELADGFDVLRERGRGRYDMELPAFDTPAFDFLTDLTKASWMPVVRKILGDDAILVHKGAFLSLPGSDTQIYHQDGPHLTTKYQRPCHAVNVFIPLVDLDERNGPTEFCLGSHFLGYEYFARDMCYTPTAPAGTPIIFDYRLGHRGLGNSSEESRPIVYLTYTPASKEFKDGVNFSRKRYKKIGDLVDKPLSRKERAMKRQMEATADKQRKNKKDAKASSGTGVNEASAGTGVNEASAGTGTNETSTSTSGDS